MPLHIALEIFRMYDQEAYERQEGIVTNLFTT
jgi:hypothetical protein